MSTNKVISATSVLENIYAHNRQQIPISIRRNDKSISRSLHYHGIATTRFILFTRQFYINSLTFYPNDQLLMAHHIYLSSHKNCFCTYNKYISVGLASLIVHKIIFRSKQKIASVYTKAFIANIPQ